MKIIFYIGSFGGSAYYRFQLPAVHLKSLGYDVSTKIEMSEKDLDADIIFIQRTCNKQIYDNMVYAQMQGCKVIYDIDDDLFNVDKENPFYDYFSDKTVQANYIEFLKKADAITVSTEPLLKMYSKYNENISVIPNLIDFTTYDKWFLEKEDNETIIIGWAGSPSHVADIALIRKPLLNILCDYPVKLRILGWNFAENWGIDKQLEYVPYQLPYEFGRGLQKINIALAPLADTKFNQSKSNLKYLEYSALGIATIASPVGPYNCITHSENGLLARSEKGWYEYMKSLIENKSYREYLGLKANKFIKQNYNLKSKIYYYEQLINQFKIHNIGELKHG